MRQSIPESFECDVVWVFFFFSLFLFFCAVFPLLYCIVWMDVSISAM